MGQHAKFTIELVEGEKYEFETHSFMCLADRLAFEVQFGVNMLILEPFFDRATGERRLDADWSKYQNRWDTFFAWRALSRKRDVGTFAAFCENLDELIPDMGGDASEDAKDESLDPSVAAALPG